MAFVNGIRPLKVLFLKCAKRIDMIYKYANELANLHILQPHQVPTPVLRLSLITSHYPYLPEHITFPHLPDHITSNWNIFTGDCAEDRGSMDFNWNSLIDYTLTTFQHGSGLT